MPLMHAKKEGKQFLNPIPTNIGGFSVMFKIGPEFFFGTAGRSPQTTPGPFRTDKNIYATPPTSGLRVTWFGHSSSLIEIDGVRILIDPVWDERASPVQWTGPKRFFPPTIALQDLPPIDVVLLSHDHFDHLGEGTVRTLSKLASFKNTRWISPLNVAKILSSFGVTSDRCTELDWTDSVQIGALRIVALPARHFSGRSLFNRFQTLWASFALIGPQHRVFYGADSGELPEIYREIGQQYGPFDLTMLEIGASNPLWVDIHMGPAGAINTFRALGSNGLLMPIHWGLFDLAIHPWAEPIESVFAVENLKLCSPTPGTPTEVVLGQQLRSEWWRETR
jgi:L-ascorbate metabolism protein UlaG (beta-lactamase superfamily)